MEIAGTVAVVTGAGGGIGRATALALADKGCGHVFVADVDAPIAAGTVELVQARGSRATAVSTDVTDIESVRTLFETVRSAAGHLDILHNNAGLATSMPQFPEMKHERIAAIADVNLKGVLLGTEIAVPLLSEDGGGVIVNSGSQPRPRRERLRGDKGRGRLLHQGVCRPQRDPRNQGELCLSGHDQHTDDRQDRLRREAGRMAGARHGSDGDDPAGRDR
ncbi:MAG TPA: SDR family NAD(P)-dependent oxidoreductase [Dehalococcoidia bacterium]|nr:SDR family NAD(P)-dependent oxidoreductase [Dehalococcoidia bacterium]